MSSPPGAPAEAPRLTQLLCDVYAGTNLTDLACDFGAIEPLQGLGLQIAALSDTDPHYAGSCGHAHSPAPRNPPVEPSCDESGLACWKGGRVSRFILAQGCTALVPG